MKITKKNSSSRALTCLSLLASIAFTSGCNSGGSGTIVTNPKNPLGLGPAPISLTPTGSSAIDPSDLGSAGNYVILAKTGISNNTGSAVTGNIGISPAAASYITGFALTAGIGFSTAPNVVGKIYAATYVPPTPSNLTTAISNMETAYTNAAGRTSPDFTELYSGDLSGRTLVPGLYKWSTSVIIPTSFTIAGGANDVWIFQVSGDVTLSASQSIILSGGAQAKNIFWQVAGQVTTLTSSSFKGIILSKTAIVLGSTATLIGRAYAQSAVTLDNTTVTQP